MPRALVEVHVVKSALVPLHRLIPISSFELRGAALATEICALDARLEDAGAFLQMLHMKV